MQVDNGLHRVDFSVMRSGLIADSGVCLHSGSTPCADCLIHSFGGNVYRVAALGGGTFLDSDKEMAYLDAKRLSVSTYSGTEVWVYRDKKLVKKYYDGVLSEDYERES